LPKSPLSGRWRRKPCAEARHLLAGGFHRATVVRSYYAAFHASRALLLAKGIDPKTHEGVRRMLGLHCVLSGELSAAEADLVAKLAYEREASDYAIDRAVTAEEAGGAIGQAAGFLERALRARG